jgi:hypothetical protein
LRVSIQDQPRIGHTTVLAAQKHTLLRRNAAISRPVHKKHVRQPLLCFDAPIGGALPLDIPLREPLDCYDEDLVRRELEGLWGAARGVCGLAD